MSLATYRPSWIATGATPGSDWPVCLLGAPLKEWVAALGQIVASRPAADQKKLFMGNALAFYGLKL